MLPSVGVHRYNCTENNYCLDKSYAFIYYLCFCFIIVGVIDYCERRWISVVWLVSDIMAEHRMLSVRNDDLKNAEMTTVRGQPSTHTAYGLAS